MKIQYFLEEKEALGIFNYVLYELKEGNTILHIRDQEAYKTWKKKNSKAHISYLAVWRIMLCMNFEILILLNRFGIL